MAQSKEIEVVPADPKFISYLLNPNVIHDTYFIVGKEERKIGAVRKMLAAHSEVLRAELEDSEIAERGVVYLDDINPEAFKNLLRYVYGFNNVSTLVFDEADDLLYAADKYLIQDLKDQLALRLMDLLDCQNICSLLNNPACHTHLLLDNKITEIIQFETNSLFENPDFLNLRVEAFVKILEQDALLTTELEIWRAAVKWAKNQAGSEDGVILRKYISQLKGIRIHNISLEDFCLEVVPTDVLSDKEVVEVCRSHKKDDKPLIEGFSEKNVERFQFQIEDFHIRTQSTMSLKQASFTIKPTHDIILLPFEFQANRGQSTDYYCDCTIDIIHVSTTPNRNLNPNVAVRFNEKVNSGQIFKVSLPLNHRRLLSNNSYKITTTFVVDHTHYSCMEQSSTCSTLSLQYQTQTARNSYNSFYGLPFKTLKFIKILQKNHHH